MAFMAKTFASTYLIYLTTFANFINVVSYIIRKAAPVATLWTIYHAYVMYTRIGYTFETLSYIALAAFFLIIGEVLKMLAKALYEHRCTIQAFIDEDELGLGREFLRYRYMADNDYLLD